MLFNSYQFIFLFLPTVLAGYFILGMVNQTAAAIFLILTSLFFYDRAAPVWIPLASLSTNYMIYLAICAARERGFDRSFLIVGIALNLAFLGYFKYTIFFLLNLQAVFGAEIKISQPELPPGISFFTFTQIMFLVDAYRREVTEDHFARYALFVIYFPHLIAGPLLHHRDIMPQFARGRTYRFNAKYIACGLTIFIFGLFKKVVIADFLAQYAEPVFRAAEERQLSPADAWVGILAFTFQLYFDFSAYCDMAIGLGLMFGVRMPINFYSPYKATSIITFWRLWHITLSRFLRDYLYIPLGGNRHGLPRRYVNVMVTMLLGGLWHGAGWNFIIWGGLHGCYLIINRVWRGLVHRNVVICRYQEHRMARSASWCLTFIAVVVGWVFFRAETLHGARSMLRAMVGFDGFLAPHQVGWVGLAVLAVSLALTLFLPNTTEITILSRPALGVPTGAAYRRRRRNWARVGVLWRPNVPWAIIVSIVALIAFFVMFNRVSEVRFLYYQF